MASLRSVKVVTDAGLGMQTWRVGWTKILLGSIAAALPYLDVSAHAAEFTWYGNGSVANWSDRNMWEGGVAPAAGGDSSLVLRFETGTDFSDTSTNDLGNPFVVNQLNFFGRNTRGYVDIRSATGNSLELSGANPSIISTSVAVASIQGLRLNPTSGDVTVSAGQFGSLSLSDISEVGGSRTLVIDSPSLTSRSSISLGVSIQLSGGIRLERGNLSIGSETSSIAPGGGTITVNGGAIRMHANTFSGNFVLNKNLEFLSTGESTPAKSLTGTISSATPGTGLFVNASDVRISLCGASTYSGATTVNRGSVSLQGNGSLLNTSAINIGSGGTFSTTYRLTPRFNSLTPVSMGTGTLNLQGGSESQTQSETFGVLSGSGYSAVSLTTPSSSYSVTINFASLARADRGTFRFSGSTLGTPLNAAGTHVRFIAAPTSTLIGGGGTGPQTSILPYAIGDNSSTGFGGTFVTYTATDGVRPLNLNTDYVTSLFSSNATSNLRLTATTSNTGDVSTNALLLDGGTLTGSGAIAVSSGAIIHRGSAVSLTNSLRFGVAEGIIYASSNLTLDGDLSGTNGLTKAGVGTLTLNGNNNITGPLTINSGLVAFKFVGNLGASGSEIVISDTGAGLSYTGSGETILDRPLRVNAGVAQLGTPGQTGSALTIPGIISGAGGLELRGAVNLTGNNTYTGPTTIVRDAVITIPNDSALGNGGTLDLSGGISLAGNWVTTREIAIGASESRAPKVNTQGFSATWNGLVRSGAGLEKSGEGTLTIAGPTVFDGDLTIRGGLVRLAGPASISSEDTIISGGALELDNSGVALDDRLPDTYGIEMSGGELIVRGNATSSIQEWTGPMTLNQAGNRITLHAAGSGNTELIIQGYGGKGYVLVRGDNLGGTSGTPYTRVHLFAPTFGDGILKGVFADSSAAGLGSSFAVYDETIDGAGTIGVRGLRANEYFSSPSIANAPNGGNTPGTAHFLASGATVAIGGANSVQTLTLEPSASLTLSNSQSLMVTTGGILSRAGGLAPNLSGGFVDFGASTGTIYTAGDLTIDSMLRGSAGIIKVGPGTLTLAQAPAYAGITTVVEGTLRPGHSTILAGQRVSVDIGGVLDLSSGATEVGGLAGLGTVNIGDQTLTLGTVPSNTFFSGTIGGPGNLKIVSGGNEFAQRGLLGTNTFSGGVTLDSGRLAIRGASALGTGVFTVNGGLLAPQSGSTNTLNGPIVLNSDLRVIGGGTLTFGPSSSITGTGGLDVRTSSSTRIQSPAGYTGVTRSSFGAVGSPASYVFTPAALIFEGEGSALNSSSIQIDGGVITLDNSLGNPGGTVGRLGNTTPIIMRSGRLELKANASASSVEVLGPISGHGFSTISTTSTTANAAEIVSASLTREGRATFLFRGSDLGSSTVTAAAKIRFNTTPSGLVGGGGTGAQTSILPYAIGGSSPTSSGSDLVTYDPVQGIRPLASSEYLAGLSTATSTTNVKLSDSLFLSTTKEVNGFVITASRLDGAGTIRITSGTLLGTGSNEIRPNIDFGAAEANIFANSALTLSGTVSGTGGLTKSGAGLLLLRGQTTLTGPLTLNSGLISVTDFAQLGPDTSAITVNSNGLGAGIEWAGTAVGTLTRNVQVDAGLFNLSTIGKLEVTSTISGSGGVSIPPSGGLVTFAGQNSYAGSTVIQGKLAIASDASLGIGGAVVFASDSARLTVNSPWTTSRVLDIQNSGTIDTNGFDVRLDGPLVSSGYFNKEGAGVLSLTHGSPINNSLIVRKGVVQLSGMASLGGGFASVLDGSELILDNSETVYIDRFANSAAIQLGGSGKLTLKGNVSTPVYESFGSIGAVSTPGTGLVTLDRPGSAPVTIRFSAYDGGSLLPWLAFRGQGLGSPAVGGYTRVTFDTPPINQNGVIPHALVDQDLSGTGNAYAVYDTTVDSGGTVGVRALRPEEYSRGPVLNNTFNGGQVPQFANYLMEGTSGVFGKESSVGTLTMGNGAFLAMQRNQKISIYSGSILTIRGTSAVLNGGNIGGWGSGDFYLLGDGNLILNGVALPTSIKKSGLGDLFVQSGNYSGKWDIVGGKLRISSGDALAKVHVAVTEGAQIETVQSVQSIARVGSLTGNGHVSLRGATLTINSNPADNIPNQFSGTIAGTGNLAIQGEAQWRLVSAGDYTGATLVGRDPNRRSGSLLPKLTLAENGRLLSTSSLIASGGGVIEFANDGSNPVLSRVAAVPVSLNSGTLVLKGNKTLSASQDLGVVTGSGHSRIEVFAEDPGSSNVGTGVQTTINAASLTRSDRGTFTISLNPKGSTTPNTAALKFSSGLSSQLVGANTTATNRAILPFAVGNANGNYRDLLTYEPGIGVRPITSQEYASGFTGSGDNVRLTSSTISTPQTANSLSFNGTLSGSGEITVTSGLVVGTGTIAVPLNFGAAEGIIYPTGSSTISGVISGSNGLTVSGPSSVFVGGTNTFTGPITLNAGRLAFSDIKSLGSSTSEEIILNDGTLAYLSVEPFTLNRSIRLSGYQGTLETSIGTLTVPGTLTGPGGVNINGKVIFTGTNQYAGLTKVTGKLTIDSDAALGTGTQVWLNPSGSDESGVLALNGAWETDRGLHVSGFSNAVIDTGSFTADLHGALTGESSGALIKKGSGILRVDGEGGDFHRRIVVEQGTLIVKSYLDTDGGLQVKAGATLSGTGEIVDTVTLEGNLSPGDQGIGTLNTEGLSISAASNLTLEVLAPTTYDRIRVTGSVVLNGSANLSLTLSYDPVDGVNSWTIIDNDGTDLVGGLGSFGLAFNGTVLKEGEVFLVGDQSIRISYQGGTGNDVVLYAVPEPSSAALLSAVGVALTGWRRKRRK